MADSPLVMFAALLVVATAAAAVFRWARCPGWPVVGGVLAGIILGPTIFGRPSGRIPESSSTRWT